METRCRELENDAIYFVTRVIQVRIQSVEIMLKISKIDLQFQQIGKNSYSKPLF